MIFQNFLKFRYLEYYMSMYMLLIDKIERLLEIVCINGEY